MSDAFAASRITHVRLRRDLYIRGSGGTLPILIKLNFFPKLEPTCSNHVANACILGSTERPRESQA